MNQKINQADTDISEMHLERLSCRSIKNSKGSNHNINHNEFQRYEVEHFHFSHFHSFNLKLTLIS